MSEIEVGILFNQLKSKLSKKDLYDLFISLDEHGDLIWELLGDLARKNFPEDFEG